MPSTPEPPTSITLKVKVPPGYLSTADNSSGSDSFTLGTAVPVTATVGALRQRIQSLIPTHPPPERQRLLYGGRALVDNEQRLGDALNTRRDPSQTEYVVHLLVKGEQSANDAGPAHRRAASTPQAQTPGMQQPPPMPRVPFPPTFGQGLPGQHAFPQIIARNQQMRAGMGMQGVGGQQVQPNANTDANAAPGQTAQSQNGEQTPSGQQAGANGQPQPTHQRQHAPGRPISGQGFHMRSVGPNGQHFQIHQQMMQFPIGGGAMPGHMPVGFPGMPQTPGTGMLQANLATGQGLPQQQHGPSALERARENMGEMRRVLEEMRNQNGTSEEQQRRVREIQQRAQSLNEYIDPLQLGTENGQRAANTDGAAPPNRSTVPAPFQQGLPPLFNAPRRPTVPIPSHAHHHVDPPSNPNEVTAYLLSSPQGPQALLFSPQHGAYTGSFSRNTRPQPTPTNTINIPQPGQQQQQQDPVAQAAHRAAQELQVQHAQLHAAQANQRAQAGQGEDGPMQALLGHFWLLMRVLIFAYFFLGSNMGWQRPLALAAIGAGFWMIRAGAFGDGAAVRRWWEGVVGVEQPRPAAEGAQQPGQGQNGDAQRNAMPTPEQVAQRLLNEQADRNRGQQAWWRERIGPVERAVALFVASLWPGVGEATVRARREMEERVRAEAEVAERERVEREERERGEANAIVEGETKEEKEGPVGETSAVEGSEGVEGLRER